MNNSADEHPALRERFAEAFSRLPEQDIEQFYAQYQLWLLRRRVPIIQKQIEAIDDHLAENRQVLQSLQPSAVALAVLARLQANGVSDIELLDQMLERGEDWLDRMMQRLDYCEQVEDFIQGDYTQWCYRSLEGAYDWIDTLLGSVKEGEEPRPPVEEDTQATEELLLQKLRLDDEEEALEPTLKQPVVTGEGEGSAPESSHQEEVSLSVAEQFLMTGSLPGEQSGEDAEVEQPPELANWEDLESPEVRPMPWYSVNLSADASTTSAQPEEMNEWIQALQEDAASKGEAEQADAAAASVSVQDAPEASIVQAERGEQAEVSPESGEASRVIEAGTEDEQVPVIEEASSMAEPSLAPEETLNEPSPGESEETSEPEPAESELLESQEITLAAPAQVEQRSDEVGLPAEGGEAAPESAESDAVASDVEQVTDVEEIAEVIPGDETETGPAGVQEVERGEDSLDESGEVQKTESAQEAEGEEQDEEAKPSRDEEAGEILEDDQRSDEQATIPEQPEMTGGEPPKETSAGEFVEIEKAQRPWYEYLDLQAPASPAQGKVEERIEPEKPLPGNATGSAAHPEVHTYASKSEAPQSLSEASTQETIGHEPRIEEPQQKRGFWQRLLDWLRGK